MLHLEHAVKQGFASPCIRTVDTDVVVLAVAASSRLNIPLWVTFGTGTNVRRIPVHEIAAAIGPARSNTLPMFHAFTGCDNVSFFAGRGKKCAWHIWQGLEAVTETFAALSQTPDSIEEHLKPLERVVILLYDRTSASMDVNNARKKLFAKKHAVQRILPTYAAL